jgi:tetratricopeptide (TPR) repeat protein
MTYAQRAGDWALAQLAPEEALRWYRQAVDGFDRSSADDPHRRAELLLGLGDAQRQTGDPAHRETLLAAAHLADDIDAIDILVRAAICNNRGWTSGVGAVDDDRVEILGRALLRVGDADSPDRARLLALWCIEHTWDTEFDERVATATEAADIARRTGDKAALIDALRLPFDAISMPQTLELRRQMIAEACELADQLDDPTARLFANEHRSLASLEAGDLATLRTASAIFEWESERIGQPVNQWALANHQTWRRMLEGDLEAAEQTASQALTLGIETGQPDALTFYGAELMILRWMQGRLQEILPLIEQAATDNPGLPAFRAAVAWAKSYDDPGEDVRQLLDAEHGNHFAMLADSTWLNAHVFWADAAARSRHQAAATALYQRLASWHDQIAATHITVAGSVAHYLGVLAHTLGRHDEADQMFTQALALHEQMEAPYFAAWTQTAWAALLANRDHPGDNQQARILADAALPVASQRGYGYIERDARAVLSQLS